MAIGARELSDADRIALERTRARLLKLPRVTETMQWGANLVFWTMDKAVGGKMFALIDLEPAEGIAALAFAAGPVRGPALLEMDGVKPAPYLARAHWVAVQDWQVLTGAELAAELEAAYRYVAGRMPGRVQRLYELPLKQYRALVRERRAEKRSR